MSGNRPVAKVSVAMATFNGKNYIREQLDSLASQTVLPYELVVTDDGSTDETLEILHSFASAAPFPVRIFQNERRLGFRSNFWRAAKLCSGDLIAFCDQDDIWNSRKFAACITSFDDPEVLLVVHAGRILYENGKKGRRVPDIKSNREIRRREENPFAPPTLYTGFAMIFRRNFLQQLDFRFPHVDIFRPCDPSGLMPHDFWVWFLCSSFGKVIILADELCLYRQHDSNTIGVEKPLTKLGIITKSVDKREYITDSKVDQVIARLFEDWGNELNFPFSDDCRYWTEYFEWRSKIHVFRSELYCSKTSFAQRLKIIVKIASSGGYFSTRPSPAFGFRALLKDFIIGLIGFDKVIPPHRNAKSL